VPRAQISGFAVISGARILVPTQLATIEPGVTLPVVGTLDIAFELATIGTIVSGAVTASIPGGVLDAIGTIGTIQSGNITASVASGALQHVGTVDLVGSIAEGKVMASIIGGTLESIGVVGSLQTSGTLPVIIAQSKIQVPVDIQGYAATIPVFRRDEIIYTTIIASLSPSTVSGTFTSTTIDAQYYAGGIGFSIAYLGGESGVSGTVLIENSYDQTNFRPIATIAIGPGEQDDRVYSPTRRYWRFTAVNPSTLAATIEAIISQLPPGA